MPKAIYVKHMDFSHYEFRYFRAARYYTTGGTTDHYRYLPRQFASIAYLEKGEWRYTEYTSSPNGCNYTNYGTVRSNQLLFVPSGATYDADWLTYPNANCLALHFELASSGVFNNRATSVQSVNADKLAEAAQLPALREEFDAIIDLYYNVYNGAKGYKFELLSRLYRVIGGLNRVISRKSVDGLDERLEPALRYLQSAPEKPISVPELAKLCKISESYFYTRFHDQMGMSPIEYKKRLMLARAQCLLVDEPETPIEDIVSRCGFSSAAYFRKTFKEISGCSPREYRAREIESIKIK